MSFHYTYAMFDMNTKLDNSKNIITLIKKNKDKNTDNDKVNNDKVKRSQLNLTK